MSNRIRNGWFAALATFAFIGVRAADWPMPGGNPARNGWAGSEQRLSKNNLSQLKLLYKYQTDNRSSGFNALTTPIISGNLITYRGFKEMLMFAGSSGKVFAVDADLNHLLWETNLPSSVNNPSSLTATCPGGLTAPIVMAGSSSSSLHFAALASQFPAATGTRPARPSPYLPPLAQSVYPLLPTTLTQLNALYAVSADGYLHVINSSTGQDLIAAVRFVPAGAKVTSLNIRDNVVYATTADQCGGYQNALFAIDLLSPEKTVTSFAATQGDFLGSAGTAIGNDGTVYVQMAYLSDNLARRYFDTVVALTPKELKVKDYFRLGDKAIAKAGVEGGGITPTVFSFPGRDLIIAGGKNGRIYLLDSRSLGGSDHHTPLFASDLIAKSSRNCDGEGFRGEFSTWLDVDSGIRRFYVPAFGALRSSSNPAADRPKGLKGSLLSLRLSGTNEQPTLERVWDSSDLASPAPAVVANGMVFVLSTGEPPCLRKKGNVPYSVAERKQLTKPANLDAFDAVTGRKLYSSGDTGASASLSGGLALANGRIYFSGLDNAVYCFGIPEQQRQLVEQ